LQKLTATLTQALSEPSVLVPVADVNGLAALFAVISRNADSAAAFFRVSDKCVIELGARLQF
jgi:hypothetical protein